jgi:hypothetical protein
MQVRLSTPNDILHTGALHENTINARMNLAVLYKKRGKVTEAKDLIRSVLEPRRDADDNNTLVARVNLANILVKEGEHDKAIELYGWRIPCTRAPPLFNPLLCRSVRRLSLSRTCTASTSGVGVVQNCKEPRKRV